MEDIFKDTLDNFQYTLVDWVSGNVRDWRAYYDTNYSDKHDEYMRLFRNQYASEDSTSEYETSKLIAPALAQAVESSVAEVEEATFGRGKIFDMVDDPNDQDPTDVVKLREQLHLDFKLARVRTSVAEVLINAAVYGTGIAEIQLDEHLQYTPATQPLDDLPGMGEVGVRMSARPLVKLNPVQPRNFLIDPAATCVNSALGVAVDEFVSRHYVEELQEKGVFMDDEYVGNSAANHNIEPDPQQDTTPSNRVRLTKYYGKVPRHMLIEAGVSEDQIDGDEHYVESIVVLANETQLLKAIPNPYMCQDRPIVAFQWDVVPSMFWGRGVCEKGHMAQKALDAELRARIDALAYTIRPMMAADATRVPRGSKLEARPGRMLLVNGDPNTALVPLQFNNVQGVTFQQGAQLQQMVSQATGAAEAAAGVVQNDVTAAGMSMTQGAIVKRQKRTLVNFQENFLIPFVKAAAFRYMQYDPNNYPAKDYSFTAYSSLGAMAREYEVGQLSQVLQTIPPTSPAHSIIIKGIVDHLNVSNREEMMAAIDAAAQQAGQPDPQAQQQQQLQQALLTAQVELLRAQSLESAARAQKSNVEAKLKPAETVLKYSDTDKDGRADADFNKRIKLQELLLQERDMQMKEGESRAKTAARAEAELIRALSAIDDEPVDSPQQGVDMSPNL